MVLGRSGREGSRQGMSAHDRQSQTDSPCPNSPGPPGVHWLPVPGRWSVPCSDLQNMATCLRRLARMLWTLLLVRLSLCM